MDEFDEESVEISDYDRAILGGAEWRAAKIAVVVEEISTGFFGQFVNPILCPTKAAATKVSASGNVMAGGFKHTIRDTGKTLRSLWRRSRFRPAAWAFLHAK